MILLWKLLVASVHIKFPLIGTERIHFIANINTGVDLLRFNVKVILEKRHKNSNSSITIIKQLEI